MTLYTLGKMQTCLLSEFNVKNTFIDFKSTFQSDPSLKRQKSEPSISVPGLLSTPASLLIGTKASASPASAYSSFVDQGGDSLEKDVVAEDVSEPEPKSVGWACEDTDPPSPRSNSLVRTPSSFSGQTEQCWPTWDPSLAASTFCAPDMAEAQRMANLKWQADMVADITGGADAFYEDVTPMASPKSPGPKSPESGRHCMILLPVDMGTMPGQLVGAGCSIEPAQGLPGTRDHGIRRGPSLIDTAAVKQHQQRGNHQQEETFETTSNASLGSHTTPDASRSFGSFCHNCGGKCETYFKFCQFCGAQNCRYGNFG